MTDADEEYDDVAFNKLYLELETQFIDTPFDIACIKHLDELDIPFTNLDSIIICDDRICPYNYYYKELPDEIRNQYLDFLPVSKINNEPITLRQILNKMIKSKHYNDEVVTADDHRFLEKLHYRSGITFMAEFGS